MIITIDGPSGSGKSTLAERIGREFGFFVINTGFLYRAYAVAGLALLQRKKDGNLDASDIQELLEHKVSYRYDSQTGTIMISYDEHEITSLLKTAPVDKAASILSKNSAIREAVTHQARELAHNKNAVAEGRDCGSIIFPDADAKLFLTASETTRAERIAQDKSRSTSLSQEEVQKSVHERDTRDSSRKTAPLKIPENAIVIDTTEKSIDDVMKLIAQLLHN